MRRETGPSWLFEVGGAPALTFALRCRDELQLQVPPAVDVPPPRTITTRGPSALAPEQDLPEQWLTWWRRLLDRTHQCLRQPALTDDGYPTSRVVTVSDTVDLIDAGPLLRYAATVADRPVDAAPGRAPAIPPDLVLGAVEQTAQRNAVRVAALQGSVHLLPGPTVWHAVVRPGYGLMMLSGPMPSDDVLHQFICEVLESGLRGPTR